MTNKSAASGNKQERTTGVVVNVLRIGAKVNETSDIEYHFLSLQRSGGKFKGQWWPVAGTCEKEELPLNTALRELREETGITPDRIFELNMPVEHQDAHSHLQGYVAFVDSPCEVTLNYEHSDYRWLSVEAALAAVPEDGSPVIRFVVDNYIETVPNESWLVWQSQ